MTPLPLSAQKRLETKANIWLASVRADGRPHLVPVWFAWCEDKLYICIQSKSVKR
jgi:nitroimidazol reductase NimA-like FMN-containing flavoprotein (pyridoxamine 5'-phosphate oxidase superfamily)